jgi:hypothetical protein
MCTLQPIQIIQLKDYVASTYSSAINSFRIGFQVAFWFYANTPGWHLDQLQLVDGKQKLSTKLMCMPCRSINSLESSGLLTFMQFNTAGTRHPLCLLITGHLRFAFLFNHLHFVLLVALQKHTRANIGQISSSPRQASGQTCFSGWK